MQQTIFLDNPCTCSGNLVQINNLQAITPQTSGQLVAVELRLQDDRNFLIQFQPPLPW